jgi:hypothetical protein
MVSSINVIDAQAIEESLTLMNKRLEIADPMDAARVHDDVSNIINVLDGATISGDAPLVLVDKARMIRDRAFYASMEVELMQPISSKRSTRGLRRRQARIVALSLGK